MCTETKETEVILEVFCYNSITWGA